MKSFVKITLVAAVLATTFAACKKNGTGGDATIAAMPGHHGKMIKGATVFVKFKATELPSNPETNYDLKIVGDAKEDHVHIEGMLPGNYFLYAVGYDSTISLPVKGGVAVTIKNSEKKKEIDVDIPVTE